MKKNDSKEIVEFLNQLPNERRSVFNRLREAIMDNLPDGFEEVMLYGMISYVVPHSIYPKGYHVNPSQALPFIQLANQKKHIAIYHYGLYTDASLMQWFKNQYEIHSTHKIDMGKSCIRFKYMDDIPYNLIQTLSTKISCEKWIELYEKGRNL